MAYASTSGRARTSAKSPRAFAVCDRCGIWYNRDQLANQTQWRGTTLQPLYIFVCRKCLDVPQEQLRAIILPADPVPIWMARPEDFVAAETDYRSTVPGTVDPIIGIPIPSEVLRITEDCKNRSTEPFGDPVGLTQAAVMPYDGGVQKHFGVPLSLLSVTADGTATIGATCSAAHGMKTGDQISAQGLSAKEANGFYSVMVISAMAFSYVTYSDVPAGPLLTPATRVVTALVGLPYSEDTIPQVGP